MNNVGARILRACGPVKNRGFFSFSSGIHTSSDGKLLTPAACFPRPLHRPDLGSRYLPQISQQNIFLGQSRLFANSSVALSKEPDKKEKEGIVKRFKKMAKDYWYVLIPVHVATSIVWFGGFYLLAKSGVDIISVLEAMHVPRSYTEKLEGSDAGYYAIAYACYKIATPARYTVTVGGTTYSIVKLEERGFIKKSSEITDSIKDKKEEMKEKYDDIKEKYQEKYGDMKDKYKDEWEQSWEKFSKTKRK